MLQSTRPDPYLYAGHEKPGEEPALNRAAFAKTVEVARWLKELLDQLGLPSFVKTTGRTGLHIYVPILRQFRYDVIRTAAQTIGSHLLRWHPDDVTTEWAVSKRGGKVFIDVNQNVRAKTLAAIFSPRALPEASVSMPLRWEELEQVYPTDFTPQQVLTPLNAAGDPRAGILTHKADLHAKLGFG